jgi:hypothetical protein
MHSLYRLAWPLIGAVALAAMVSGHALELWLENLRILGDGRANYAHPAQTFAIETAAALFVFVLALIAARLVRCAIKDGNGSDCLVPALDGILRLGPVRTGLALVSTQFGALIGVELLEQRWSGLSGSVSAIVGPGHFTAIAVHVFVGFIFALALYRVSRFVHVQTRIVVGAITMFLRRVAPERSASTGAAHLAFRGLTSGPRPPLLALGLANRPPPVASTTAA